MPRVLPVNKVLLVLPDLRANKVLKVYRVLLVLKVLLVLPDLRANKVLKESRVLLVLKVLLVPRVLPVLPVLTLRSRNSAMR